MRKCNAIQNHELRISVILPCYNERKNLPILIDEIHSVLASYEHEIVVVDDNSPDGTYDTVVALALPYVNPIKRTKDKGFARSIQCGIEHAKGDVVVIMDSDFNHQPQYLPFMLEAIRFYDCVSASRFLYGGKMYPASRNILSWLFNIFVRIMTGGSITDSLYGFVAIRRDILFELNFDDIFWGYGDYCVRFLYYLQNQKRNILQMPAINGRRLNGKGNNKFFSVFLQYFTEVLLLTYRIRIKRYVQRT